MSSLDTLEITNRIFGEEIESVMLAPVDPERWVPPGERDSPNDLEQVGYYPLIEEMPPEELTKFDDEIPSRNGHTSPVRIYREVAGGQIEYATSESTSVVELIRRAHKGQALVHKIGRFLFQASQDPELCQQFVTTQYPDPIPPVERIVQRTLGKNGTTLGMHENYLADRAIDLKPEAADRAYGPVLMSHLVTRLWSFSGGVRKKTGNNFEYVAGAKLSTVRTDYNHETTTLKPIINTRDEPHADNTKYRRNHITCGDGNMWPWPEFMKFTTTSLVHRLVENGVDCSDVILDDAVAAASECAIIGLKGPEALNERIRSLSVDVDGKPMHPLELQLMLIKKCEVMAETCYISPEEEYALVEWRRICEMMLEDALGCQYYVEFIGKLAIGSEALGRRLTDSRPIKMNWNDFENAWCDLDPRTSLGIRTRQKLSTQQNILQLDLMPYERTRADARADALAWGQHNISNWPLNIWFYWDKVSTEVASVLKPDPYDDDPEEWLDLLARTKAERCTA